MRLAILSLVPLFALGVRGQYTTDHVVGTWTDGAIPNDLRTFDVDADGDLDVFMNRWTVGAPIGVLSWYKNLGAGVFAAPAIVHQGNPDRASDFDLRDLDGDGDLDIVYCTVNSNDLIVRHYDAGSFGAPEVWGSLATGPRYLRFIELPGISWWWLIAQGASGEAHPYYLSGNTFVEYQVNGNGADLTGVINIEVGNLTGYLGDIVVQTTDRLWIYTIYDSSPDNYAWATYEIGYCDDRIQIYDIEGYGDVIGRTNTDTVSYTTVGDFEGFYDYTDIIGFGNAGFGTFGRADCDNYTDLIYNYANNGGQPNARYGSQPDGFEFQPPVTTSGLPATGSFPVLADFNGDGLNDLLEVENGNSLHWYTNGGLAPQPVTLPPFPDTLATCSSYYYFVEGVPAGGYFTGPHVVPTFEFGEYFDRNGVPAGNYPITYHASDNNGCLGSATQYLFLLDSVAIIPPSLSVCPSETPVQFTTQPADVFWTNEDVTFISQGLLDISYPFQTDLVCVFYDATQCPAYGSAPVEVRETSYGYAFSGCECSTLCTNDDPVTVYRSLPDGTEESIPFDPAVAGIGIYSFIGYADETGQVGCFVNDTFYLEVQAPPNVTLDPFLDTLANTCFSGFPLTGGSPTDGYNSWSGPGTYFFEADWYFDAYGQEGNIPVTYTHYDDVTGCSNSATQPITVIDSVVVVPDSINTCPSPDPIQVLTYPNAVWGSNEVPNGVVDVSFPHQQHYLCYWTDVVGCGVYGSLAVNVAYPDYGYAATSCECSDLCTNGDPITVYTSQADGGELSTVFDPAASGPGSFMFVGYGYSGNDPSCPVNDTLYINVQDPPIVTLTAFTDTLVGLCQQPYYLTGGQPANGQFGGWIYSGTGVFQSDGVYYFQPLGQLGDIPITYEYTDYATGCSATATQIIHVIDQVIGVPPSLITCPSDEPYQLSSIPVHASWFDDGTTTSEGLVDISTPIYTYAYCSWTDVLGCEATGEVEIDVQEYTYGEAYIVGSEGPDTLCTNSDPVEIHRSLGDGTFELIPFDPATAGTGLYSFVGYVYDDGESLCLANDTLFLRVLPPPTVTLDPFLDTLANTCFSGFPLTGGSPTDGYNSWSGAGTYFFESGWYFDAFALEGNIPVTYIHTDDVTGCSNSATQPITVIDSVVVVPDSIVSCPVPDPFQVLTYPNAVWGSNEVPNGVVDLSYPHQQHYLCYWTDIMGCGVYGALAVNVAFPDYGYVSTSCECSTVCTNGDPITITRSLADGNSEDIVFDPSTAVPGVYPFVGYGYTGGDPSCPVNDTLYLTVADPPIVTLEPFLDTLANTCFSGFPLTGGSPTDGNNTWSGAGTYFFESGWYFDAFGLEGNIPVTYIHTDDVTGCSNSAIQTITVIDSVVVVPDSIVSCPVPDPFQVLTYPNAVWGSNEVPNGVVDLSYPHQQHYLCYWTDVMGCGVYGALAVNVAFPEYGYVTTSCECSDLCVNDDAISVYTSQSDGTELSTVFDPAASGPGTYMFVGYGYTGNDPSCPQNDTLYINVYALPTVSLTAFTDTLVGGCANSAYALTGGFPVGGYYYGNGVDDPNFYPANELGQVAITYEYTDENGCTSYATEEITVIDSVTVTPDSVQLCLDGPGAQFTTIPVNAIWASDYVTPDGTVLTDQAFTGDATCFFTDVLGCQAPGTGYVDVENPNSGYAYVNDGNEDDILCSNGVPVTITRSLPDGTEETVPFDPAIAGVGTYTFIGYGDVSEFDCAINDTLYVQVVAPPVVSLDPFTDLLASGCGDGYPLTGGLPAGGYYEGDGVDGDFLYPFALLGQVPVTYYYTDGNGCTNYDTEEVTVIDAITAAPDAVATCPDTDPVQLASIPPGAVWSGSTYVTPGGSLDVSTPNNEAAIGTWTDVVGCTLIVAVPVDVYDYTYGTVEVVGYDEPVSLCVNTPTVDVLASQADGSTLTTTFDPSQGAGTYDFTGFGPTAANCPVDVTLTITVNDIPAVSLTPFTDTLVAGCSGGYVLTGGLPAGGSYDGPGVNGDFFPFAQSGEVPITYEYTDGNGCTNYATEDITVIDAITAVPDAVATCPDTDPVQLASVPAGAVWSGSTYVTPAGSLDVSTPNNEPAIGTWTDVIGCAVDVTVPVSVYDYTYGTVEVVGYDEPVSLCVNTPAVDVLASQADGSTLTTTFDPSQGAGTYDFTGFGPTAANCPVDVTLTITVNDIPAVSLTPFTDTLVAGCSGGYVLTGGLPAGGFYDGPGVNGDFFPFAQSGEVPITYEYTDANGCTNYATEDITVIDHITAVPDAVATCPDTDPVQLTSVPSGAVWSGSTYVTPDGSLDVSTPNNEAAIGTWTDVIGCAVDVTVPIAVYDYTYGTVEVVGHAEPVSLCTNNAPVNVLTSQPDGTTLNVPFDPSIAGPGEYTFVGYGPDAANCPVNDTLIITVNAIPNVTLAAFTDTLVNVCPTGYALTSGLPAGGVYSGAGVNGDFFPESLSGQVDITYTYTDGNGCANYATEAITVLDQLTATPAAVTTCPDTDPVQLASVPTGAVWSGSAYVTPGGSLDVATPNNEPAIGTWTDVIGCALDVTVPVTVNDYTYGTVEVVGYNEPVSLCLNTTPVTVETSQPDGSILSVTFDPSAGAGTYDFIGYAPTSASCPVDVSLTISVNDIPNVTLDPFTDTLVNVCPNAYALTTGLPAGGVYSGTGVNGDFFPEGLSGQVDITYTYTDGNGCANYDTEAITVVDALVPTIASVTTCPDTDPVQLSTVPPGSVWSGSPNVTSGGLLDVSDPYAADIIGTWTDVIGCALEVTVPVTVNDYIYGTVEVVGYTEPVSLCVNATPVTVGTSQPDGSILSETFDPSAGAGSYDFIGYAPSSASCGVDVSLTITVNDLPTVTLDPFTDTLVNVCPDAYPLTTGLPAGGVYSGTGVNGDFFPQGLSGQVDITYTYTDGNGCGNYATEAITVIGQLDATPDALTTCPGLDPIQLYSSVPGTVWSGSTHVSPSGLLDLSTPFTADITGTWTDVTGCAIEVIVPVTVNAIDSGYAYVVDNPDPVVLCESHAPVTVITSLAAGGEDSFQFDPASQGAGQYTYTGFAPGSSPCPVDVTLTIDVVGGPVVTLALPYDELCSGSTVALSGGLPAGGLFTNYNGTGDQMNIVDGANAATYEYTDVNGCSGTATDQAIGVSVTEANGYDINDPVLCPNDAPLVFEPSPQNGTWSGAMNDEVFDPSTDTGGAWSYTITDEAGNSCAMSGTITALPYTPASLEASATTVCMSGPLVQISGTNALGGTINGPIVLDSPFDPFNPSGSFDPSAGLGDYDFSMDVAGDAQGCAWSLDLTVTVVDVPNVTVSTFTDTLLNICAASVYTLTQGLPAGGTWSGPGVTDNGFSASGLTGPQTLTYSYSAGPGCEGSATGVIEVVSEVTAAPYNAQTPLYACEGSDPVQLTTVPSGAAWTGAAVTPQGYVGMAAPYNGQLTYVYTDAAGCQYNDGVPAVISAYSMGYVDIQSPGATQVCGNTEPFEVHLSTAEGVDSIYYFDPAVEGPGIHPFTGVAPLQTDPPGCYQDAVVTIQVLDTVELVLGDDWALESDGSFTLTGGSPTGGTYNINGVDGSLFSPADGLPGANVITYTVTAGPCPGTATDTLWVSTVGIADLDEVQPLQVWPVPTRDELFISMPGGYDHVTLTLVDAGGREVVRRAITGNANGTPLRWDIGSLANGSYTLWTIGRDNIAPARVVIAH